MPPRSRSADPAIATDLPARAFTAGTPVSRFATEPSILASMRSPPCCSAVTSRLSLPPILCPTIPENAPSSATTRCIFPSIASPRSAILPVPAISIPTPRAVKSPSSTRLKSGLALADSDQRRSRPRLRGTPSGSARPSSSPSAAISSRAAGSDGFALHDTAACARPCAAPVPPMRSDPPVASIRTRGRSSVPDTVASAPPRPAPLCQAARSPRRDRKN